MTSASEDIKLPLHGEDVQQAFKASLLPPDIKAIYVSGKLIFARWGLRGWSQLKPEEDRDLRNRLNIS